MVKRSHILACIVLLLATTAAGLRTRSQLRRAERQAGVAVSHRPMPEGLRHAVPPEPVDYVAHPWVAPEEAGRGPARILSLAPSITEIVCALGMADRLVGRTPYCRHPPEVAGVPEVGGLIDTNFERIRALAPDLVLVTASSLRVMAALDELELPYLPCPHETLDEVYAGILRVGDACGRPRTARALVGAIWADIRVLSEFARSRPPATAAPQRTIILLGEMPAVPGALFVAGPDSFLESFLQLAGHTNAARDVLRSSHGEIPLEVLRRLDPDVILEFREPGLRPRPGDPVRLWLPLGLKAIDERRIRSIGGLEWLSAGPRAAIALHRFIVALSPDWHEAVGTSAPEVPGSPRSQTPPRENEK